MSTSTFVISYAYTVTYVTDKMLFLLKEIIRDIGLDPSKFASDWADLRERRPHVAGEPPPGAGHAGGLRSREQRAGHLLGHRRRLFDGRRRLLWVDAAAVRYAIIKQGTRRRLAATTLR